MSVIAASAIPIPNPGVPFAKVFPHFDELGDAGQRLWIFLWEKTGFGTHSARITDREIALACGMGIRWVQKALDQLLHFQVDGVEFPVIARFRNYGPRHIAGRVIEIIVNFVKPADKPAATKARPKHAATATTHAPAPAAPATPPPPPEPKPTPEETRQAAEWLRAEIARINAEADAHRARERARLASAIPASLPAKTIKGVALDDLNYLEVKEQLGALTGPEQARLDALRGNRSP